MRFVNPAFRDNKNKKLESSEESMILDRSNNLEENKNYKESNDILNTNIENESKDLSIEFIRISNNAKITDIPRSISLNTNQMGKTLIKYENYFEESISKGM